MEDKNKGLIQLDPDKQLIHRFRPTSYLIGKVITSHPCPLQQQVVKSVLSKSWKCMKNFSVIAVSHNTFIFTFEEYQDCMHVLLNVPWNVKGGLLVLSPWIPGQKPEEFNFNLSPFWVQVHQLPPEYMTPENGVKIGNVLGKFIYSERHIAAPSGILPARDFLRIRVFLDIRRPLLTRYLVKRTGLSDIWIQFRYEELGVFCFTCGLIGSYSWSCDHRHGQVLEKYNTLLSVPPCSEVPAIRVPQMFTMLKRPSDSGQEDHFLPVRASGRVKIVEEESPDKASDTEDSVSSRVPQMNTMLKEPSDLGHEIGSLHKKVNEKETEEESSGKTMGKESSDLGQEILSFLRKASEEEKESEEESSEDMFDSDENFSTRAPQMNTMASESAESDQEVNEEEKETVEEKDSEEESSDQMFDADENFPTRSGMQMLVINGLVTMVTQAWSRLRVWFGNR